MKKGGELMLKGLEAVLRVTDAAHTLDLGWRAAYDVRANVEFNLMVNEQATTRGEISPWTRRAMHWFLPEDLRLHSEIWMYQGIHEYNKRRRIVNG